MFFAVFAACENAVFRQNSKKALFAVFCVI
jgi:hypothetical protein